MPLSTEPKPRQKEDDGIPPQSHARARPRDPDAEAIAIAMRFAERLEVAQSLVRLVSNIAQQHAAVYAAPLTSHVEQARRLAHAATRAAIHAATQVVARRVDGESTKPKDERAVSGELDHETLHDDAC